MGVPVWWYKVLHPRPVYLIVSKYNGKKGIMAASWVMPVSEEPPRVAWAASRDGFTLSLVKRSGEFTINVVFDDMVNAIWQAGSISGWNIDDKPSAVGVALTRSRSVSVPRVEGAVGVVECRIWGIIESGEVDLVIGDVVDVYILRKDVFNPRYGWIIPRGRVLMHVGGRAFTVPGKLIIAGKK